jgi:hypothetical protein
MATPGSQWTDERCAILRERYPHENTAAIARFFGATLAATNGQARKMGLKKAAEYLARRRAPEDTSTGDARTTTHGYETRTHVRGGAIRQHVMR